MKAGLTCLAGVPADGTTATFITNLTTILDMFMNVQTMVLLAITIWLVNMPKRIGAFSTPSAMEVPASGAHPVVRNSCFSLRKGSRLQAYVLPWLPWQGFEA